MQQRGRYRGRIRRVGSLVVAPIILLVGALLFSTRGVNGFAKKKSGGKKIVKSSTLKGFGVPHPSLEDVLAKFPTRIPPHAGSVDCPCGSSLTYADCCGPLHNQSRGCLSMIDVLRSRYSAFCWRNIGHILATTHPTNRDYRDDKIAWANDLNKEGMFDSIEFVKLEVGTVEPGSGENEGFIEFQVTMRGRNDDEIPRGARRSAAVVSDLETIVKERSRFVRDAENCVWSYAGGNVTSAVEGLEDTKLNV